MFKRQSTNYKQPSTNYKQYSSKPPLSPIQPRTSISDPSFLEQYEELEKRKQDILHKNPSIYLPPLPPLDNLNPQVLDSDFRHHFNPFIFTPPPPVQKGGKKKKKTKSKKSKISKNLKRRKTKRLRNKKY